MLWNNVKTQVTGVYGYSHGINVQTEIMETRADRVSAATQCRGTDRGTWRRRDREQEPADDIPAAVNEERWGYNLVGAREEGCEGSVVEVDGPGEVVRGVGIFVPVQRAAGVGVVDE